MFYHDKKEKKVSEYVTHSIIYKAYPLFYDFGNPSFVFDIKLIIFGKPIQLHEQFKIYIYTLNAKALFFQRQMQSSILEV